MRRAKSLIFQQSHLYAIDCTFRCSEAVVSEPQTHMRPEEQDLQKKKNFELRLRSARLDLPQSHRSCSWTTWSQASSSNLAEGFTPRTSVRHRTKTKESTPLAGIPLAWDTDLLLDPSPTRREPRNLQPPFAQHLAAKSTPLAGLLFHSNFITLFGPLNVSCCRAPPVTLRRYPKRLTAGRKPSLRSLPRGEDRALSFEPFHSLCVISKSPASERPLLSLFD